MCGVGGCDYVVVNCITGVVVIVVSSVGVTVVVYAGSYDMTVGAAVCVSVGIVVYAIRCC